MNGESTELGHAFTADDVLAPEDRYGLTKLEIEKTLFALGVGTGLEVVIIRPMLVYRYKVRNNFARLMRAVK